MSNPLYYDIGMNVNLQAVELMPIPLKLGLLGPRRNSQLEQVLTRRLPSKYLTGNEWRLRQAHPSTSQMTKAHGKFASLFFLFAARWIAPANLPPNLARWQHEDSLILSPAVGFV